MQYPSHASPNAPIGRTGIVRTPSARDRFAGVDRSGPRSVDVPGVRGRNDKARTARLTTWQAEREQRDDRDGERRSADIDKAVRMVGR